MRPQRDLLAQIEAFSHRLLQFQCTEAVMVFEPAGGMRTYNIPMGFRLRGELDREVWRRRCGT
jgi:hypothetical protein